MASPQLYFHSLGAGNPILFLHGFMENSTMWPESVQQLPGQKIFIDLHGHGMSPFNGGLLPSISVMADQVEQLMEQNNWKNCQVVGHSLGGYVALELFRRNLGIEHITLLHSHSWADSPEKKMDRLRIADLVMTKAAIFIREAIPNLFHRPAEKRHLIDKYVSMANEMSSDAIAWAALAMRDRPDLSHLLQDYPTSFTVVQGVHDHLIPVERMRVFQYDYQFNYIEIPECGHMSHEEQPYLFLETMKALCLSN